MPKISVIMSVYNDENYLRDCIESILNQTFKDFEFIITNDASTDDSLKIIEEYASKDKRIRVVNNKKNLGLTDSLNNMIDIAHGKYIARMDGDDIAIKNRFEEQLNVFKNCSDIDMVFTDTYLIDDRGKKICPSWRPKEVRRILGIIGLHNYIPHPTVMLKRDLFIKYGKYNSGKKYYRIEDLELWQRFIKNNVKFYYLKKRLLNYRINPNSVRVDKKVNYCFKLANTCIANNNKKRVLNYFKYLSYKEKLVIGIKTLIPFKVLFYKGLMIRKYIKKV